MTKTMNEASGTRTPLHTVWQLLRDRQAGRATQTRLERELAAHTTPNDIADLRAAVARYDEADGAAVYRILEDRLVA